MRAIFGRRMSASISRVFLTCENAKARLVASVVLPSSGTEEVSSTTLRGDCRPESSTLLRMVRIASENAFWFDSRNMRSSGSSGSALRDRQHAERAHAELGLDLVARLDPVVEALDQQREGHAREERSEHRTC